MNDYRIEMTVRNNRIYTYIRDLGYESVAAFCRAANMDQVAVGALLNMKRPAVHAATGEWTQTAKRLAQALACEPDDLWSNAQRTAALESNKRAVEISEEEAARIMYDDQETLLLEMERSESVEKALSTLRPREQKVIRMRMGLAPYDREYFLHEIGEELGCGAERVRGIEAKALRHLRHPKVSMALKDFV